MKLATLALRTLIGGLFVGHGTQKLFGWFGGSGLEATSGTMEKLELRPPRRHALSAGAAETAGGALLALGALTPVAATLIVGSMVTAIRKVHAKNGVWNTGGGYEYNAVLIAAVAGLVEIGPGPLSVDSKLFPRLHGTGWAIAAVAAGAGGSYLATSPVLNEAAAEDAPAEQPRDGSGRFARPEPAVAR
jgi:putative oxidoreductase